MMYIFVIVCVNHLNFHTDQIKRKKEKVYILTISNVLCTLVSIRSKHAEKIQHSTDLAHIPGTETVAQKMGVSSKLTYADKT